MKEVHVAKNPHQIRRLTSKQWSYLWKEAKVPQVVLCIMTEFTWWSSKSLCTNTYSNVLPKCLQGFCLHFSPRPLFTFPRRKWPWPCARGTGGHWEQAQGRPAAQRRMLAWDPLPDPEKGFGKWKDTTMGRSKLRVIERVFLPRAEVLPLTSLQNESSAWPELGRVKGSGGRSPRHKARGSVYDLLWDEGLVPRRPWDTWEWSNPRKEAAANQPQGWMHLEISVLQFWALQTSSYFSALVFDSEMEDKVLH